MTMGLTIDQLFTLNDQTILLEQSASYLVYYSLIEQLKTAKIFSIT